MSDSRSPQLLRGYRICCDQPLPKGCSREVWRAGPLAGQLRYSLTSGHAPVAILGDSRRPRRYDPRLSSQLAAKWGLNERPEQSLSDLPRSQTGDRYSCWRFWRFIKRIGRLQLTLLSMQAALTCGAPQFPAAIPGSISPI